MALDEAALEACYRRLEKPMYNVLYRWLWNSHDCMDVIQEVFLKLWMRRGKVDVERIDALAWTTALNLARNRLDGRRRWRWLPLPPGLRGASGPEHAALAGEREQRLRRALEQLPAGQREVLLLGTFGNLKRSELAEVLGLAPGTVASRHHHAVKRLENLLNDDS